MPNRSGRKSASQTPAPKKDRISGSKVNPKGSASSEKSASAIKLDAKTLTALTNKLKEFKEKHPNADSITIADLKAVYRRGAGAYSSSHRPTISGGKPNSRNAWAMARVNKFLLKAGGTKVKKAYVQDDDLMKMHLGGDMSKHLAPNGKPSNLTHEQWHLVRTPEFKAWFGDWENDPKNASKVVDENGEPLVVYHRSNKKFTIFDKEKIGKGFWKTAKFGFYFSNKNEKGLYGNQVYKCFIDIKEPYEIDTPTLPHFDWRYADFDPYVWEIGGNDGLSIKMTKIEKNEADLHFCVFEPTQIKLADGSNTTFDGGNPDIRYADGGEVIDQYTKEKIKKAYVSIRIKKETKKEKEFSFTYIIDSFDEKPFEELKEGELKGVKGISTSNYNVSEWLVHRDCLVMMPFDEFLDMNNAEQVLYYDANYLTKNGLEPLFRLYDRKTTDDSAYYSILQNLFPKISNEFTIEAMSSKMGDLFYFVGEIFNPYNSSKFLRYVSEQPRIQSPEMFAQIVVDYINSGKANEDYYSYKKFEGVEAEKILIPLIKGIEKSGSIYKDESEWILKDDTLRIPEGSQLFFVLTSYSNMKEEYEKMIDAYGLRSKYKIYYVDYKDLSKFQQKRWQKKDANFKKELESFRGDVNKKISNALLDIENEILAEFERNLFREIDEDEYMHPEYFKDYDGNKYATYMEIPEVVNFYNNFVYKLSQIIEEAIPQVVSGRNKYYLNGIEQQVLGYINLLDEENRYKDFEFMDEYGTKFNYYDLIYKMKRAFKDINVGAYADSIKERVGGDLYRAYSKDELMFKDGGTTEKYEISDYWDTELFGGGGEVKTKKIITDKIGFSEEIADYLIELSPKLAIWIADSLMKEYVEVYADKELKIRRKELLKEMTKTTFRTVHGSDIRLILDWLQHPITEKQNLKELTFTKAIEKARVFHDELTTLGGDIDFIEPEGNEIFITYPKDKDGAEFYWVKIPSNFCSLESSRMGHCGRTGYGNTLISLRSVRPFGKGHTINDSHVTIAYNEKDGIFYQTKGKKNQKPAEKYHQYIFDLVKTLAQEDRHESISEKQNKSQELVNKRKDYDDLIFEIEEQRVEISRKIKKYDSLLNGVKNSREYDQLNKEIEELMSEKAELGKEIKRLEALIDGLDIEIIHVDSKISDLRRMYRYGFGGFGAEYGSEEDYGFGEMNDEQVRELYEINPSLFSNLGGRIVLYNRGIVKDKPDTTFILEKDVDQIEDLLDYDGTSKFLQSVITGDMYEAIDNTTSDHEVITWYLRELNDKNMNYVLDEISSITSIPIEEVKHNGAKYYLSGDYMDDSDEEYDFDSIINAVRRAVESALESDAYDYYYGEIKSTLSELGEVLNLNDEGIKIKVELTNALTINQIEQYSQEVGDDLESIFFQAEYNGDITLPNLGFDDRFSPSADSKLINEYFEPDFFDKGGVVRSKRLGDSTYEYRTFFIKKWDGGQDSYWNIWGDEYAYDEIAIGFRTKKDAMDYLDKWSDILNKNLNRYKDGGEVDEHKETYKKWKSLVNMSKSELERFYNSQEGKDAGLSSSEANAQGIDSGRESARWIMKMKDTPYKEWTPQMWKWAKKQISFISRMSGNKGGLYDDKGRKTRKHTSLLIWGNNPEKMSGGGETKGEATYKDVVELLKEYQFRLKPKRDNRYETWRNSTKVNGEEVDCFIDTKDKRIVLESQHGLKEIGYDLKFMESYFKKNRLKINKYNNGGEINQTKNINMDNVRFNQLPHIDTISEGDSIVLHESVFAGSIDQPKHIGERYIHCKAMSKGGMVDTLNLEVIKSVGTNPLVVGQLITRPIANVLVRGRKLIVEPVAQAIEFAKGGLNPDNKDVKGYFAHGSGNAGGVLVGKRHSEGGIKAINKSTGQPLEMEGGEVVITRGAVSNPKKYEFDGKEMTTREILSKLNVDGGGVSFAEGGDVPEKMSCGCKEFKLGGQTITPQEFVAMSEKQYDEYRLQEGVKKERHDHYDTLSKLNAGAITIDSALREIAEKEMSLDKKYPFSE